jgi:hypothetical protein
VVVVVVDVDVDVDAAQELFTIVVPPSVTEPVVPMSCPFTVVLAPVLTDAEAMTWPTIVELAPKVAELPICQKTLQACAPPVSKTVLEAPVIKVEAARKINTADETPCASKVKVPLIARVPLV